MKTKNLAILVAIGTVVYFAMKKKSAPAKRKKPGMISSLFNDVGESIKKPLEEVAEDIPERAVRPGLHQTGLS